MLCTVSDRRRSLVEQRIDDRLRRQTADVETYDP
jgi:hypothetical protein